MKLIFEELEVKMVRVYELSYEFNVVQHLELLCSPILIDHQTTGWTGQT